MNNTKEKRQIIYESNLKGEEGEDPVLITEGDVFEIIREGKSGKKVGSSWRISKICDGTRISMVGIPSCRVIEAELTSGIYINERVG